ncbi:hypothetical protein [Corynebacterium glyciniphilum]|uniref:hypothetical protein n=1 Tax=Corynebacterium glyciniphilum TaxID=1404244 RepID=UPI003FD3EA9A
MSEEEWIEVAAAAERYHCSMWKIGRWIKQGQLETRVVTAIDPDGRWVITTWLRVRELDDVSGVTARAVHVRKIRATAQPFTDEQKRALRKVFLAHLLDREEKRVASVGSLKPRASPRSRGDVPECGPSSR